MGRGWEVAFQFSSMYLDIILPTSAKEDLIQPAKSQGPALLNKLGFKYSTIKSHVSEKQGFKGQWGVGWGARIR